jgi:translin
VRFSANAIRAVHRGEFEDARDLIGKGDARLREAGHIQETSPQIFNAGFMNDARKEFTEANVTLAVISGAKIPTISDLKVDAGAYINGMAEVIGELRRYILDALRRGAIDGCQELMDIMDEMYSVLVTIDFPEGVTSGLRRNTDAMRGVLERTRGDLTMALRQHSLEARLAEWENNRNGA